MGANAHKVSGWQAGALVVLGLCLAGQAQGQAVLNPNQVVGTIEFTNSDPAILSILESPPSGNQGFHLVQVTAQSQVAPPLFNRTDFAASGNLSTPYEITVESGPPGAGIPYFLRVLMFLDQKDATRGQDQYFFLGQASDPVVEEDAADVVVDFSECAGLLDIRWETPDGTPFMVDGGTIHAYRERAPGSEVYDFQAQDPAVNAGSNQEYLAVRGDGSRYRVDISYDVGTDPFRNQTRFFHQAFVTVECDRIVEVTCPVQTAGEDGQLGEIVGEIDMLGEVENRELDLSLVRAVSGPLGNFRLDTLDVPAPSQGAFSLQSLVPSENVDPPAGYIVYGDLSFRSGDRYEYFRTPSLSESNGRVFVMAGELKDLGDTFVIDPGFVAGDVFLAGPRPGEQGACLEDMVWSPQLFGSREGRADYRVGLGGSFLMSLGQDERATGASQSAEGGFAQVLFGGAFDSDPGVAAFEGDYDMVLGGLLQEASIWSSPSLQLGFSDQDSPDLAKSYQRSTLVVANRAPDLEIVPGQTLDEPMRYCFGQLNLSFISSDIDFYRPKLAGSGRFSGSDFESNLADYDVEVLEALGTPTTAATESREGMVVACLPEGTYDFTPEVFSRGSGGGLNRVELPPLRGIEIGCRQIKELTLGHQVNLDSGCTTEPVLRISGEVEPTGDLPADIEEIVATVNGGPPISLCTSCGENPLFSFSAPAVDCDNTITVSAVNTSGLSSATTSTVRFDASKPLLTGCEDIFVDADPSEGGMIVDFLVSANDGCDGALPVPCSVPSGSFFPLGETEVSCWSQDTCENAASCTFKVVVAGSTCSEGSYWPLDEGSGLVAQDESGNSNDGVLIDDPAWVVGQQGSGLRCEDGYVRVDDDDSLDLQDSLSLAVWIKPEALGGSQMLVSKDDAYELEIGKVSPEAYSLRLNNQVVGRGNTPVRPGVWQHLAVTWDGAVVRYFYNGQPDGSAAFTGSIEANSTELGFCARPYDAYEGCPIFFFEGSLDDIRLYRCAVSNQEIADLVAMTSNDVLPPVLTHGAPAENLASGTSEVILSLETDENATCRFSVDIDTPYNEMSSSFDTVDSLAHQTLLTGLEDEHLHRFYVRCQDVFGNTNATDFEIGFDIGEGVLHPSAGYWPFDEARGCLAADKRAGRHGRLGPACDTGPQWTAGRLGSSLSFAGGADEVLVDGPDIPEPLQALTLAAWIRHEPASGFHAIIDRRDNDHDGYDLYIDPDSGLFMRVNSETLSSHAAVADGLWHHVVGTYDGVEMRLYIDGALDREAAVGNTMIDIDSALHMGRHFRHSGSSFLGDLDEVVIYHEALSETEVLDLFHELQ